MKLEFDIEQLDYGYVFREKGNKQGKYFKSQIQLARHILEMFVDASRLEIDKQSKKELEDMKFKKLKD